MTVLTTRPLRFPLSRGSLLVALAFCAFLVLLGGTHRRPTEHLSKPAAEAFALRAPVVREQLARYGWDRVRATPLDDRLLRLSFFKGPEIVLEAAVAPDGTVTSAIRYEPGQARVGGDLAQRPPMMALLIAAFLLAALTVPLRSMRNLDLVALASFAVPILLMNARLLEASVYSSYPPLAYLCLRCALVAFRGPTGSTPPGPFLRLGRPIAVLAGGAAVVAFVLLAIPGGVAGDVALASMAGATDLTHGVLPYGHLSHSDLVHGDTYPLLAYAAYVPAALIAPVKSGFDQIDGALWVATGFALVAAAGMRRIGGPRLAIACLTFPPVVIAASAGSNDLVAAACLAWAAALIACAGRSATALAVAGLVKLAPFFALPLWVARERGSGLVRALVATAAAIAGVAAWVLVLGGLHGLRDMADALSFQAERGSLLSIWALADAGAAQVAVQAAVATLVLTGAVQLRRERALARDPRRVGALAAAALLGVQLAANSWSYTYLAWVFPLVALALLSDRRPAAAR